MPLYRLTLELRAPLGTPLVGPTLFGQLCWLIRERSGEAELERWLGDPERAWRISDGFPSGFIPKPLTRPRHLSGEELEYAKARKKRTLVCRSAFLKHRHAWAESALPDHVFVSEPRFSRRIAHNHVHRSGRGTLEQGGLYFLDEDWRFARRPEKDKQGKSPDDPGRVDLYIETAEGCGEVSERLIELGELGYGRDASAGRGRWRVIAGGEDPELAEGEGPRRMTLTRGIVDHAAMRDALWKVEAHYGRAGPQLSLLGISPFKKPVLLARPGMTFTPEGPGPWGAMLHGLHPRGDVPSCLNARHIAIPFAEAEEGRA